MAGRSWHCDETYIKVQGRWCYRYRAIDRDGNLGDTMLCTTRDMAAAKRFFSQAIRVVGYTPEKVNTDGHDAYPRAIRETLGPGVMHRCSRYLNNKIEQDHRDIKGRYHSRRGFGDFADAARFCSAYDEGRDYFGHRTRMGEMVPVAVQRTQFRTLLSDLRALFRAA